MSGATPLLGPGPEPETDAGAKPPGTSAALIRRGQRDSLRHQARQTRPRCETRLAGQARIHDHANTGDGEAGLGQVRGQYQTPLAIPWPREHPILLWLWQSAMEGQDLDALLTQADQPFPDAFDFTGSGQKDEQVACMANQALTDGGDEGR